MVPRRGWISRILIFPTLFFALILSWTHANGQTPTLDQVRNAIAEQGAGWVAGENDITRLSPETRKQLCGAIRPSTLSGSGPPAALASPPAAGLPVRLDWRDYKGLNYVTAVTNQKTCGSCWAFATAAALESQMLITENKTLNLSEQTLVSCSGAGNCYAGGYIELASDYIVSSGLPQEKCLPYQNSDWWCRLECDPVKRYRISKWEQITWDMGTVDALKNGLYSKGPLAALMGVYSDFNYYTGGVYTTTANWWEEPGWHAILIVGYDDANQCFIAKNSWGKNWGESGFFRIAYSEVTGRCLFGSYAIAYSRYGSLQVTLGPAAARTDGARWRVDGGTWQKSGATVPNLRVGPHTVRFKDIEGWVAPPTKTVTVPFEKTLTPGWKYTSLATGSLRTTIQPQEAISAGARWSVDGGDWMKSGTNLDDLTTGSHEVAFKSVAGWAKPATRTVAILEDALSETKGTYKVKTGSLQATISPPKAVTAGAQWRVDGGDWNDSGAVVPGLPVGTHTIQFKLTVGWTKPNEQTVTVLANQTGQAEGAYVRTATGTLRVTITPPGAVSAGAGWKSIAGDWIDSGDSIRLNSGTNNVYFKTIGGWVKPEAQQVDIPSGTATSIEAAYSPAAS